MSEPEGRKGRPGDDCVSNVTFHPLLIFVLSFAALWLTAWVGAWLRRKEREQEADFRDDFGVILAATLTLLALIIGFSFSMATTRYDQRKNYEEQEANAIGTEYLRADLLSPVDAAKVRSLLRSYLDQRILFYTIHDEEELRQISARRPSCGRQSSQRRLNSRQPLSPSSLRA